MKQSIKATRLNLTSKGRISVITRDSLGEGITLSLFISYLKQVDGGGIYSLSQLLMKQVNRSFSKDRLQI
jgi:hypothetical protein